MARLKLKKLIMEEPEIMIAPLIDCVFLLLLFFMVSAVFKNPVRLKTVLPFVENAATLDKRQLTVELDPEGNIAVDGVMCSFDSFDAYLVSEKQKTGTSSILIRADGSCRHADILRLMTIARSVEIETMAIAVEDLIMEQ